ncbi:MAG: sulfite exporter TauE/SafE family protein [Gammaproteobacteria bacterium]|nr:sulfite exporter TauE/SafE family protein [Gammaproteobacteria bacterium]
MHEFTYISAFAAGLLGGVHCIGMCGGIVGALSFGIAPQQNGIHRYAILMAYNLARISSYVLAGAFMAGITALAVHWLDIRLLQKTLQVIAAVFMLLLGFYLAGWWLLLARVEKMGGGLWRLIEPMARRFLPVRTLPQAFALGLLWGWLPCGLVYSVLIWSVASANALDGALLMLCFGLGTLPNLLAMGVFAQQLNTWVRQSGVRQLAGVMVMGFGLWNLYLVV